MIRAQVDLNDVKFWKLQPSSFAAETYVSIGEHPGALIVVVDKRSADKARQIGALLIAAAERHDPTGLELVRVGEDDLEQARRLAPR
jgi:hypothetical protein